MNSPKIEEIGKGAGGVSSNATTKSGGLAPTLNPSDRLPPSMVPRRIGIDMEGHTLQQDQLVRSILRSSSDNGELPRNYREWNLIRQG